MVGLRVKDIELSFNAILWQIENLIDIDCQGIDCHNCGFGPHGNGCGIWIISKTLERCQGSHSFVDAKLKSGSNLGALILKDENEMVI